MEEQLTEFVLGILAVYITISYFGFMYYAMLCGRYKCFINKHLKKEYEFMEWVKKRKEMYEW